MGGNVLICSSLQKQIKSQLLQLRCMELFYVIAWVCLFGNTIEVMVWLGAGSSSVSTENNG